MEIKLLECHSRPENNTLEETKLPAIFVQLKHFLQTCHPSTCNGTDQMGLERLQKNVDSCPKYLWRSWNIMGMSSPLIEITTLILCQQTQLPQDSHLQIICRLNSINTVSTLEKLMKMLYLYPLMKSLLSTTSMSLFKYSVLLELRNIMKLRGTIMNNMKKEYTHQSHQLLLENQNS